MPDQLNDISFHVLHTLEMFIHSHHSFYSDKNHLKDCIVVQKAIIAMLLKKVAQAEIE